MEYLEALKDRTLRLYYLASSLYVTFLEADEKAQLLRNILELLLPQPLGQFHLCLGQIFLGKRRYFSGIVA